MALHCMLTCVVCYSVAHLVVMVVITCWATLCVVMLVILCVSVYRV